MIRATPNSVRWDEVNCIKYRFQALHFNSDVLETLIKNSPPLPRRDRSSTSPLKTETANSPLDARHPARARLQCGRRTASLLDASRDDPTETIPIRRVSSLSMCCNESSGGDRLHRTVSGGSLSERKVTVVELNKSDGEVSRCATDNRDDACAGSVDAPDGRQRTLCHVQNSNIKKMSSVTLDEDSVFDCDISEPGISVKPAEMVSSCEERAPVPFYPFSDDDSLNGDLQMKSKEDLIKIIRDMQARLLEIKSRESRLSDRVEGNAC